MKTKPMSNEEFKDRIRAICGPTPKVDHRPCVRTPDDRGYYPPSTTHNLTGNVCECGHVLGTRYTPKEAV